MKMSNNRGSAISAGKTASLAMGPVAYAEHRKTMRALYEKRRRARVKALREGGDQGMNALARKVRADGE